MRKLSVVPINFLAARRRAISMRPWIDGGNITRDHVRYGDHPDWAWQWAVCPACMCLTRWPRRHKPYVLIEGIPQCQALSGPVAISPFLHCRRIKVNGVHVDMVCGNLVWLFELSPGLHATIEAAFLIKGPAAVIDIIDNLGPVEIGLDDPGGAPHAWELPKNRRKRLKRRSKVHP